MIEPSIADTIFSTIVVTGVQAAACHWAWFSSTSLVLFDWSSAQFTPKLWNDTSEIHDAATTRIRLRFGSSGCWIEGESLAQAANAAGLPSRPVPDWLTKPDYWTRLGQFAASQIRMGTYSDGQAIGNVRLTDKALAKTKKQAFGGVSYRGEERGDDPTIPAFLFGITLALDPTAATDPTAQTVATIAHNVASETAARVMGALR